LLPPALAHLRVRPQRCAFSGGSVLVRIRAGIGGQVSKLTAMSVTSSRSRLLEGRGRTQIGAHHRAQSAGGRSLTDELRHALKERARSEEREFTVRRPTNRADALKRDARNYQPGMVVEFHQATSGERHGANGRRENHGRL